MKKIKIIFQKQRTYTKDKKQAEPYYTKSRFGEPKENTFQYSLAEALYLKETKKAEIYQRNKKLSKEEFIKKAKKIDKRFWIRYVVYKELRKRGYITKTALKFGADFRVYDRGIKPGQDHAKWIVFPIHESETMTWYDFSAKNRVAHSTKKKLLLAVVDDENDVSFWESNWIKP